MTDCAGVGSCCLDGTVAGYSSVSGLPVLLDHLVLMAVSHCLKDL